VTDPASGTAERYALIPPDVPTAGPMPGGVSDRMLFVWEERRESATYMGSKVQGTTFVRQLSQTPVIANVILEFSASDSNREIKRWIATNTVLSIGVLLLLFTSVLVLLFLYQRTGNQRIREQEFVATMSHELRLPVTVIKAVADNIASGIALKPERLKRYGTELCLEANRLIGMVESILLYSGLQSGNLGVETVSIQLQELADSVISGFRSLTEQKGITLKANVTARPDTVIGDRKGIRTVMENLLMNAIIHAAPAHGQCTVILSIHRRPFDRLVVSVEDSGPGIPAREQKKIFSPFYRTRASVDGQHPGSGLGLHLVKRIVELNHGSVSVASPYTDTAGRLCTGARFTAEFRIDEAAANG
jgi:signal transduction histidine kinase